MIIYPAVFGKIIFSYWVQCIKQTGQRSFLLMHYSHQVNAVHIAVFHKVIHAYLRRLVRQIPWI